MYLLVIIGLIVVFVFTEGVFMGFPMGWIATIVDIPSLVILLLMTLPVLPASGLGKDFVNAFRLFFGKKGREGLAERKKAVEALDERERSLKEPLLWKWFFGIAGGIFAVLLQFIGLCNLKEEYDMIVWRLNLAVMIIPLVYAYMIKLLLLPIKSRLNKEMIDFMDDAAE